MNIANQLSVLRMILVPIFVGALLYYSPERSYCYPLILGAFLLACLTDGVDGYLARKLNEKTVLGSYIDPIADKLLLLSGFLSLSFMEHLPARMRIPAWLTIPIIARDVIILIGSTLVFLTTGKLTARPLFIGKLTTVLQMASLFVALTPFPHGFKILLFIVTLCFTLLSGLRYIRMGGRLIQSS